MDQMWRKSYDEGDIPMNLTTTPPVLRHQHSRTLDEKTLIFMKESVAPMANTPKKVVFETPIGLPEIKYEDIVTNNHHNRTLSAEALQSNSSIFSPKSNDLLLPNVSLVGGGLASPPLLGGMASRRTLNRSYSDGAEKAKGSASLLWDEELNNNQFSNNHGGNNTSNNNSPSPPAMKAHRRVVTYDSNSLHREMNSSNLAVPSAKEERKTPEEVLSQFRNLGTRPSLLELRGCLEVFAMNSHGSRYLQSLMENASSREREELILELCAQPEDVWHKLVRDGFANYVVQNFVEYSPNSRIKQALCARVLGNVFSLAMDAHACRVIQKMIDSLSLHGLVEELQLRYQIINELLSSSNSNVAAAARSPHASHVLQKVLTVIKKENLHELGAALDRAIAAEIVPLLCNVNSYRFCLNVFGNCNFDQRPSLAACAGNVVKNLSFLASNQQGNFVIQHVLQHTSADDEDERHRKAVFLFCKQNVLELSRHKFGSHIIEKCFTSHLSQAKLDALIEELLRPTSKENLLYLDRLRRSAHIALVKEEEFLMVVLLTDAFGNFVIQKAIARANPQHRGELLQIISNNIDFLSKSIYGKFAKALLLGQEKDRGDARGRGRGRGR